MVAKNNLVFASLAMVLLASAPGICAAQDVSLPATEALAADVEKGLESFRPVVTAPKGAVVAVKGDAVYISNENDARPREGSILSIVREKEPITHPVTGEILGMITDEVASVEVVSSDEKLITAKAAGGAGIMEGDRIGEKGGKPKAAVVFDIAAGSVDAADLRGRIGRLLDGWKDVSIIPSGAVERLIYDEKITDRSTLAGPARQSAVKERLKADYLIYLGVREDQDAILSDLALFDLPNGEKAGSRKGLTRKHAGGISSAGAEEEPEKVVIPLAKAETETPAPRVPEPEMEEGEKARVIGGFNHRAVSILSYDLDKDGANEVVIGFDHKVAVFEFDGGKLELAWEKEAGPRNQTTGLCAGDFDSDGNAEIYVNNLLGGRVSSYVIERTGDGAFAVTREDEKYLFYAGEDGKLYGQRQAPDNSFENDILSLTRDGGGFKAEPFLETPPRARLSGIAIFDMDGDGVQDAAGFDYQYSLAYRPSSSGAWKKTPGRFGGSNISVTIASYEDTETYHVFQPPVIPLGGGRYKSLLAAKNTAEMYVTIGQRFTQSQLVTFDHDGVGYYEKKKTPVAAGVINAVTLLNKGFPNIALVVKNEPSLFGPGFSEITLVDLDRY